MKIFGLNITRASAEKALHNVGSALRGGWSRILEPFSGAWQRNAEEKRGDLLTYPTLYACISRIASDIGKLPFTLQQRLASGVSTDVANPAYSPVLNKPNGFQTQGQFREYWMIAKLTHGNTYALKRRDLRGVVVDLYILDSCLVMPMVSDAGEVFYQLYTDPLNTLPNGYPASGLIVPASEIIHDRCMTLHHPLIGVPPLAAAYWPALKNMKILRSATEFFANNAQPGGILTAPAGMSDEDAADVKAYWDTNFTGTNAGRVAIIGADMKFTPFAMKSIDSQMVEQMRYSDEQICQPFGIPPFKVGIGTIPSGLGVDGVNQMYYQDALQTHIEHMESLLNEGLKIAAPLSVELDLAPLLRMDEAKRAEVETKLVGGKIKLPDEARQRFNLAPTPGGSTLWGQQQDYPLGMLADRKEWDPAMQPPAPAPAPPEPTDPEPPAAELSESDKALIAWARSMEATNKAISAMRKVALPEAANV
jgi:HK97 family phage portal protein